MRPQEETKILGVVMDSRLRFKNHVKKTSARGLKAVLSLKRMRALTPTAARQLFNATVAPIIDYASSVWMHVLGPASTRTIRQIPKLGGQAITGAFSSVAETISEVEAFISPVRARHWNKAVKTLVDLLTLPANHPMSRLSLRPCIRFKSPLQRISQEIKGTHTRRLENIEPYIRAP